MFQKKPQPTQSRPQAASRPMAGPTFSILGADTAIKGDISASADLHVDGKVEGDISCSSLVQGESGEVIGAIVAESARLAGKVCGTISVRELVILRSARIEGDVNYDALTIEQGAQVDGRLAPRGMLDLKSTQAETPESHLVLASSKSR
jgi:cytoskeletal protein CcmA (bactofilin family)